MSRSTRSSANKQPLPSSYILLHGKPKAIPTFLTIKHYPTHGIRADKEPHPKRNNASSKSSNTNTSRKRPYRLSSSSDTSPQKASHLKSKKASAIESTYPPTQEELNGHDVYLNRECMRLISLELNQVVDHVLRRCCVETNGDASSISQGIEIGGECRRFFDMFAPKVDTSDYQDVKQGNPQENTALVGPTKITDGTASRIKISFQPVRYPPTLLPMIIIKCYPNILDRNRIVRGLVHDFSSQFRTTGEEKKRSCVCVLNSNAELVEQGNNLIAEILFQVSNKPHK